MCDCTRSWVTSGLFSVVITYSAMLPGRASAKYSSMAAMLCPPPSCPGEGGAVFGDFALLLFFFTLFSLYLYFVFLHLFCTRVMNVTSSFSPYHINQQGVAEPVRRRCGYQ